MHKAIATTLCAVLANMPLFSLANQPATNTLRLYNWADYIGEDTIANFEKSTGIKVIYDVYDGYETVQGKLLAGRTGYDLVVLNAALATPLIEAQIFQPLDKQKLPSWNNLDQDILRDEATYDPGMRYSSPYLWGSNGVTYNVDMIKARMPDAPIGSLAMIFDPKIVSRFADCGVSLLDAPTEVIPLALTYLGKDPNSTAPADIQAAQDVLMAVRPYIRKFDSSNYLTGLPNGEVCMAMTWSGDYATAIARAEEAGIKINLAYFIPKEGSLIWFDNFYIPSDASQVSNAHKFLEYLLQPEVMAGVTNYVRYANGNLPATALVNEDIRNDPAIYPDPNTRQRLFAQKVLSPTGMRLLNRTWTSVKSGK